MLGARAAQELQRVERGRKARVRTAKDREAMRSKRLARQRQEALDQMLFSSKSVSKATNKIHAGFRARQMEKEEKKKAEFNQRQANREEQLSLEEDLRLRNEAMAAEAARIEAERRRQSMVCCGPVNPFSPNPGEAPPFVPPRLCMRACGWALPPPPPCLLSHTHARARTHAPPPPLLLHHSVPPICGLLNLFARAHTEERSQFAEDVRTGQVIRCVDGITRVVYSLEEARAVIATRDFTRGSGRAATINTPRAVGVA